MYKAKLFIFFGIWVAVLPYLGLPFTIKNVLFSVTGLLLVYIGLVIRSKTPVNKTNRFDNFSENKFETIPRAKIVEEVFIETSEVNQ